MRERCVCGGVILWPRNVCAYCHTPTTSEQRLRMQPQPVAGSELDALERELTQRSLRIQTGCKYYPPEFVLRLVLTIRQLDRKATKE